MNTFGVKGFAKPDETRPFVEKGRLDVLRFGDLVVGRMTLEPGWHWSEHVKPLAGTPTCEVTHTGYCLSGRLRVRMDDGAEKEIGPSDSFHIPPGHDAWVVGNEACILLDFTGMGTYAERGAMKPATKQAAQPAAMH